MEATTGSRYAVEELKRAGAAVQPTEPADPAARGPTDKRDARHLRLLLLERRLPQAWIAPKHILDLRALVRLRNTLVDQRTEWLHPSTRCSSTTASGVPLAVSTAATRTSSSPPWTSRRRSLPSSTASRHALLLVVRSEVRTELEVLIGVADPT